MGAARTVGRVTLVALALWSCASTDGPPTGGATADGSSAEASSARPTGSPSPPSAGSSSQLPTGSSSQPSAGRPLRDRPAGGLRPLAAPAGTAVVTGVGFGADEASARASALGQARDEAAKRRGTQITAWVHDVMTSSGDDRFEIGSVQSAELELQGATHRVIDIQSRPEGVRVELELYVPREQIEPSRVLDELEAAADAEAQLRAFATRAEGRGDVPAAHLAYQRLLEREARGDDVLRLASLHEGQGAVESAILVIDRWSPHVRPADRRLAERRALLADRLLAPHAAVAGLLAAAERMRRGELSLSVDHEEASVHDAVRIRGAVPSDAPLLLVWFDQESIDVLRSYTPAELAGGRLDVDIEYYDPSQGQVDTTGFVPGRVDLLALSCPQLALPPTPVDLAACARDDMAQRRRLSECLAALEQLLRSPAAAAQVLTWDQVDD